MATSVISLIVIESKAKLTLPTNVYWMEECHHFTIETNKGLQHPLPEDWVILRKARLTMECVGWLGAIGKYFTGMTNSLNIIGVNSVWIISLSK